MVIYTAEMEGEVFSFISGIRYLHFGWMMCVVACVSCRDYYIFVKLFWLLWSDAGNYTDGHNLEWGQWWLLPAFTDAVPYELPVGSVAEFSGLDRHKRTHLLCWVAVCL